MSKKAVVTPGQVLSVNADQFGTLTITFGGLSMQVMNMHREESWCASYGVSTSEGLKVIDSAWSVNDALSKQPEAKALKFMFDLAERYFEHLKPEPEAVTEDSESVEA